jgi:alkylhydroperoxidase/carboxymuconolactone decarboxylase family protein YurZ
MDDYKDRLRKLALRDEALVTAVLANEPNHREPDLDAKTHALVRLSATVAVNADQASYQHVVERAIAAGASTDEIVGTLVAVISLTGVPRAIAAAPRLALALGYDIDTALERYD